MLTLFSFQMYTNLHVAKYMARTVQYAPNASNMDTNGKEESACIRDGHPYFRVGEGGYLTY